MNKTLFGLAYLSYTSENQHSDIIDSHIPLVSNVIVSNNLKTINRNDIHTKLSETFGLDVPKGGIEAIIKRMIKQGSLKRNDGEIVVVPEKIGKTLNEKKEKELTGSFNKLIQDFQSYSKDQFQTEFTTDESETGLIAFLREHDLDIMFASAEEKSVLPEVKESKKIKYILAKFITNIYKTDSDRFESVQQIAKGYALASLIAYENILDYSGALNNVAVYLDAPIIFNLLGLNGEPNLQLSKEIITSLKKIGARLKIFEINHGEVVKTIQDAIQRLESGNYDFSLSSRVLRTALREGYSAMQLKIKFSQLESVLKQHEIEKLSPPTLTPADYKYQIDEQKLTELISDLYAKSRGETLPYNVKNQIGRDVEAISGIFKIRKGSLAQSLKNSKAILLTTNEMIAFSARIFEQNFWEYRSTIPVCITDIFLSTILWANYPNQKADKLNIKRLISGCYSMIELNNRILRQFYEDVERMHKENALSEEDFLILRADKLVYTLLQEKTFNDIDEYTDKTPKEILEDIKLRYAHESHNAKENVTSIVNGIRKFSNFIGRLTFLIIILIIITVYFIAKKINPSLSVENWENYFAWIFLAGLGIFGILRWAEVIPTKTKIENYIEGKVFRFCCKKIGIKQGIE